MVQLLLIYNFFKYVSTNANSIVIAACLNCVEYILGQVSHQESNIVKKILL